MEVSRLNKLTMELNGQEKVCGSTQPSPSYP